MFVGGLFHIRFKFIRHRNVNVALYCVCMRFEPPSCHALVGFCSGGAGGLEERNKDPLALPHVRVNKHDLSLSHTLV